MDWKDEKGAGDDFNLNYWQSQTKSLTSGAHMREDEMASGMEHMQQRDAYRPECVIVEKVFNECSICDCRPFRLTAITPAAASVTDCEVIETRVIEANVIRDGEVFFTVEWTQRVTYLDIFGETQVIDRTFRFARRVNLMGARMGMRVRILPLFQCLNCTPIENGIAIECEVGFFIVIKVTAVVQLEIERARYCPPPPVCGGVLPFGCPEWAELCETNAFWPPWPPQPSSRRA